MPTLPTNQLFTAEIQLQGIVSAGGSNSRRANFVFHFVRPNPSSLPLTETALETAFNTNVVAPILLALNNRFTQTFTTVRFMEDPQRQLVQVTRAGVGAVTGDSMAMHMQAYILMRTATRGRFGKGNKKFFPLSESDTTAATADLLNAGAQALWATAMAAMGTPFADANGNTWTLVVLSRKPPAQYLKAPCTVVVYPVTQILLNKRIGRNKKREVLSVY